MFKKIHQVLQFTQVLNQTQCWHVGTFCCCRWRDMPCSVSFPWTELSWSRAAPLAPLTSTTFTTLVCCTLCRPTASPACASLNILSCLPLPPPVTGQVRSRSGTDRLLRRKENEKGDCRTLKFNWKLYKKTFALKTFCTTFNNTRKKSPLFKSFKVSFYCPFLFYLLSSKCWCWIFLS